MRPLEHGDTIAIVEPATRAPDTVMNGIEALLASHGYKTKIFGADEESFGRMAGNDRRRAELLTRAFRDPEVSAVFCARGGYGSGRLLDIIDPAIFSDKIFVGYSDATNLLLHINSLTGRTLFHGPMCSDLVAKAEPSSMDWLVTTLEGSRLDYQLEPDDFDCMRPGSAEGQLIGGNITIIESLIGTPSLRVPDKAILLLEDVGEFLYAFDRSMVHLGRSGILEKASGIIFADLSLKDGAERDNSLGMLLEDVLDLHFSDFTGPIAYGLPCGHTQRQMTLPIGARAHLEVDHHVLSLRFSNYWDRTDQEGRSRAHFPRDMKVEAAL